MTALAESREITLGQWGLGGSPIVQDLSLPLMQSEQQPYIAHLYDRNLQFKRLLGGVGVSGGLLNKPGLKLTQNGGYQQIVLELAAAQQGPNQVVDPGFENDNVLADVQNSWSLDAPGEWSLMSTAGDLVHGGRGLLCTRTVTAVGSWNGCHSKVRVPVVGGGTYVLSGWSKQNGGARQSHIKVTWVDAGGFGTAVTLPISDGSKPWTFYSGSFVAPQNAVTAEFAFMAGWWGNLLTVNQASIETDTTGLQAVTNCTISRVTSQHLDGVAALQMNASAAAASVQASTTPGTGGAAVTAGQTYTAVASLKAFGQARTIKLYIQWWTSVGTASAVRPTDSTSGTDSIAGWIPLSVTAVAPSDAAFASVMFEAATLNLNEKHFVDNISLQLGTVTDWADVNAETWFDDGRLAFGSDPADAIALGDVVRLSEQGDNLSTILFSGNVETVPEAQATDVTAHEVVVSPWVSELGDGHFNQTYASAVDVAQWVRDAVAITMHCSVTPISCPDTGVKLTNNFQDASPLDAIHQAKQAAGWNFFWHCDAQGVVWFQAVYPMNPATLTVRKGADLAARKPLVTLAGMKNRIPIWGGSNPGDPGRIRSQYDGGANQALYGIRAYNPTLSFPQITDQPTLDAIAAALGALYDRVLHSDDIVLPAFAQRLIIGRPGGLTMRVFEDQLEALLESSEPGFGTYGPVLVVQDVEVDGPGQHVILGDVPFTDIDPAFEAARVAQRISVVAATSLPIPALVPQVSPATTTVYGKVTASPGIKTMGGGIVAVASATFTTPIAGTCQVIGAVDARMEAWDNYIATPRRAVRASLSGGIFTGSWQELPFGLARANYDLSSASGLALAAGTYTVKIEIDTQEYNQMHIYSGYVQVAVTA